MGKYKICPMCAHKNSPAVLECIECGNDLMGVKIVDDSIQTASTSSELSTSKVSMVKLCDCGTENDVAARKCTSCGEDISDIIPTPKNEMTDSECHYRISSVDGNISLDITTPSEHVLGREKECSDYLSTKPFVSRCHAKLYATTEGLFVQNLSKANGTFINNEKVSDDIAYKLCDGDEIGLGGNNNSAGRQNQAAYFIVKRK